MWLFAIFLTLGVALTIIPRSMRGGRLENGLAAIAIVGLITILGYALWSGANGGGSDWRRR